MSRVGWGGTGAGAADKGGAGGGWTIEVLRGRGELGRLRGEWERLWERCPGLTPFQHPDWLIPWANHFGGGEFLTGVLRRGGTLLGLAPFFVCGTAAGRRDLLLLGTGNTDYLDLLLDPAFGADAASALLGAALAAADCQRCDLRQLRPGSPLLEASPPAGWTAEVGSDEPCPVLPLPGTMAGLGELVGDGHLARVRRDRRRLERQGTVRVDQATEPDFDEFFDALVRLHELRWARADGAGIFGDPTALAFHREAARALLGSGWLHLHALRLDERIIACHYTFGSRGRIYNYLGGFDPDFSHWSPGTLLMAEGIEAAIGRGVQEFDFLRGREPYKYGWGARDTMTYRRRLAR